MNKKILTMIITFVVLISFTGISTAQENEGEDNDVQRSVEERLQAVRGKLKAYIGTVTSKTDETMQLESDQNEIKLVSISDEVTYASINGATETIEFDDVGIGDYVITMGTPDENNVLTAKRIVVSSQADEIVKNAYQATITGTEDGFMIRTTPDNTDLELELNRGYLVTETNDEGSVSTLRSTLLNEGDTVILIGVINDGVLETDRIHRIEQAQADEEIE